MAIAVAVALLLALPLLPQHLEPALGGSAHIGIPTRFASALSSFHSVRTQVFSNGALVQQLVSNGSVALLAILLPNSSNELVVYNAATNTSRVVQAVVPGGAGIGVESMAWAGNAFIVSWFNFTAGTGYFERVTKAGSYSIVSLPVGNAVPWLLPFGNASRLFVSGSGYLVAINPRTLRIAQNYSLSLPKLALISSLLPSPTGAVLYVAGSQGTVTGNAHPFFGFLSASTGRFTLVSRSYAHQPSSVTAVFLSMAWAHGELYLGGYSVISNNTVFRTNGGMLYKFNPVTGVFSNLSVVFPNATWGVWSVEPWGRSVMLVLGGYTLPVFAESTGEFQLSSTGTTLVNRTALFPSGFLPDFAYITSEAGPYYFVGGEDLTTASAEIVAVRV